MKEPRRLCSIVVALAAAWFASMAGAAPKAADAALVDAVRKDFFRLADIAVEALEREPTVNSNYDDPGSVRAYPQFFVDSYAVRALAVAADLSGRERYLEACITWSDRMVEHQRGMVPAGAYYMNYHRKPGETTGQWFVADCGSIAMGVLATALRCDDAELREKYMTSVKEFLDLVAVNYVRPTGGITDGIWDKSDDEWWCSTALVAAAALQYYGVTGERRYLELGLNGVDWLLDFDYDGTILYDFTTGAATTIFYVVEAYASALPYMEAGSERRRRVISRLSASVEWMADTQNAEGTWDYNPDNWGMKLGGLPCHMLIYLGVADDDPKASTSRISPGGRTVSLRELVARSAARALAYFSASADQPKHRLTQQDAFTMMSYAEKLCPGELYARRGMESSCADE